MKDILEKPLKGKRALTAAAKKAHRDPDAPAPKTSNGPNSDKCCHCKQYGKLPKHGHCCKLTGKPTPRKATCPKQEYAG